MSTKCIYEIKILKKNKIKIRAVFRYGASDSFNLVLVRMCKVPGFDRQLSEISFMNLGTS